MCWHDVAVSNITSDRKSICRGQLETRAEGVSAGRRAREDVSHPAFPVDFARPSPIPDAVPCGLVSADLPVRHKDVAGPECLLFAPWIRLPSNRLFTVA